MVKFLLIGLAGALGTWARYLISVAIPNPTLAVNIIGSFLICFTFGLTASTNLIPKGASAFIVVGVLGGFTTYSAFTYETMVLLQKGEFFRALMYVATMVLACLFAGWLGFAACEALR